MFDEASANDFSGTQRYRVRGRLGEGGFGVVYEAEDALLGGLVALKVLHRPDGDTLYRFKQEFRTLADIKHRNLVSLHELASESGRWFFTMDLVDGVDILRYLSPAREAREQASTRRHPLAATQAETVRVALRESDARHTLDHELPWEGRTSGPPLELDRIRDVMAQLVRGVSAIHDAGKVHRDLKPANILVESTGRVVVLDFGLVTELDHLDHAAVSAVGTPSYMAPEQAAGGPVGPASDWYSVGCILYRALTGRLPVTGNDALQLMQRKQSEVPPPPRLLRDGVPPELDALCVALLERSPTGRPRASEILSCLPGATSRSRNVSRAPVRACATEPFVGRHEELARLGSAFARVDERTQVATVRGPSGIGKSTLVRQFLDEARSAAPDALLLSGRCYERENVPYKALDAIVDQVSRFLQRMPAAEKRDVLPDNPGALTRIFPVLRDVAKGFERRAEELPDALEQRRRGFAALRQLLSRTARTRRIVLFIDDLQWTDADSLAVLVEVLAPPTPPRMMLVLGMRSEAASLLELVEGLNQITTGDHLDHAHVELGALGQDDARKLVAVLLGDQESAQQTARIVDEGAGVPFMLSELVSFSRVRDEQNAGAQPVVMLQTDARTSLVDAVVRARAARLEPDSRRLLETICVAGQPLARSRACRAAGLDGDRARASLDELHRAKLIRVRVAPDAEEVETFHDRVSEAIVFGLAPTEAASRHASLAQELARAPSADPERLGMHLRAAGDLAGARTFVERAADRAAQALAFEQAARLYRIALEMSEDAQPLRFKLAEALANAGRGAEAGRAYLAAVHGAPREQVLDLRRCAAEQFLRSGHLDEAFPTVEGVLDELRIELPATPLTSFASLLVQRGKLWARGLDFVERTDVAATELRTLDVFWALGNGLASIDIVRGADFLARHLLLALQTGEPYRISRGLAFEASVAALEGGAAGHARAATIAGRAMGIARRIDNPHALAWATAAEAICQFCHANWRAAASLSAESIALFREHCANIGWEIGTLEFWWWLTALRWTGDYSVLNHRAEACAKEAHERGDQYTATGIGTHVLPHVYLVADRPDDAARSSAEAIRPWSNERWLTLHWADTLAQVQSALYAQRIGDALAVLDRDLPRIAGSLQTRVQNMRIQNLDARGRVYIAAARDDRRNRRSFLARAEACAASLEREGQTWAVAFALLLRGGAANVRGDGESARGLYLSASRRFWELHMEAHALAAEMRFSTVEGGAHEGMRAEHVGSRLSAIGARNPMRYASSLAP